ncbi:MAG: hypothetical protein KVP17_000427, partial [Porospora cf. gigantea B]|uniref:uncharacterized protein n=1 Tax=Porospora cf. gigantea B TaxID=2853592 RepID=UPI003571E0B0
MARYLKQPYVVKLFAYEPTTVGIRAKDGFFVDHQKPRSEAGLVEKASSFEFVPRVDAGNTDSFKVWVSTHDRNVQKEVEVIVETVKGHDPRLRDISTFPGRLDPLFRPNQYAYVYRIPWFTEAPTVRITTLNERETDCVLTNTQVPADSPDRSKTISSPGGSYLIPMFDYELQAQDLLIACHNRDDPSYSNNYTIHVVRQKGGDTLLTDLDVLGGTFNTPFVPEEKGPYRVDLSVDDNEDLSWVAFHAVAGNPNAIVTVEGRPVDSKTDLSPFFRLGIGEVRRFKVEVKTAKNPIEEEYYIDVHRNPLAGESPQKARALGNFIGWGTAFLSADKAFSFLYNTKLLQWVSATGRLNNSPETYDSFASSFHKWNLIFRNPERVRFSGGCNNTFVSPPEKYAELIQMYDIQDEAHANKDFLAALDHLGAAVPPFVISQNGNWVDMSPSEPLVTQSLRSMLFRQWNDNLVQVARANHAVNLDIAESASPVRALREIAPADKTKLLRELNVEMKKSEAVLDYINSIFVTSCVLLGAAVMYMFLWLVWLRNKNAGFLTLRRDFPKILHPARFWTFLFDFTFVSFMMATAGIAFYSGKDCSVYVYGINTTPRQVQIFAIAMLIAGPLCYFLAASSIVTVIRKNLVFTKSTQTWQDDLVIESKAMHTYLRWFPVISDLLSIEIRGATPIFRPEDHAEGHTQVAFKEETRRQPDFA